MDRSEALERATRRLGARSRGAKPLPALLAFTDPLRSHDVLALASSLPRGSGLVYRAFGAAGALETARRLRRITWRRGVLLFIGGDVALARASRADGLHVPERLVLRLPYLKSRGLRLTAAAHSLRAARQALGLGAEAVVVSPLFESESPSAGRPFGALRFADLTRKAAGPVYALGGIGMKNARRAAATGVVGLAAVGAFEPI